ncbi:hypothetical protein [Micromonospora sp. NPDC005299]|uniref:hypothetical protein n=1 Tax=Micromonospora sp. NPDC005299 TaxID=3364231 RepID=UPI0036B84D3C
MSTPTSDRPLAVVTGASSGIGYELAALMKGEHKVSAGSFVNKLQTAAGKIVPDRLKAEQHRRMAEPGSGS